MMKRFGSGIVLVCLLAAGRGLAQFAPHEMFQPAVYTNAQGQILPYRLSAPQFPKKGKKYPIILFLHGSGECGTNNYTQTKTGLPALMRVLVKRPEQVIVVAPQCRVSQWWVKKLAIEPDYTAAERPMNSLKLAIEICQQLMKTHQADPDRFYITGLSLGGFGTWDAIQRDPTLFAAAAPICGGGDTKKIPKALRKLPIYVAHGAKDQNVPVDCSRRMVEALAKNGCKQVKYVEFPEGKHTIWDKVYGDPKFVNWLLTQTKKKPWWKFWGR
ncbi:MAG: prolyl oligopeptidase family serine peptidase [Kiritimatiellae bacterium]|nr:prolyl oligopeptidase family serine peptidase [Kiritimatiellia bacterium]